MQKGPSYLREMLKKLFPEQQKESSSAGRASCLNWFFHVQWWMSFLTFSSARTQIPFLSTQLSNFITFEGIQHTRALSSNLITISSGCKCSGGSWWIWLPHQGQQAGSDPLETLKSLWGRMDGPHLSTAKNIAKVQTTKCMCLGCQYLLCALEELILNWASPNFLSFISLETKGKPVDKTSVLANVCQAHPYMQCLRVPWTTQHIPQTSIILAGKFSSYATSYSRMKARQQNNQHCPLACWSYVTFIGT